MRCLVTAGPTYESLDQVRRLTNSSTGRLGAELAAFLVGRGHEVTLLIGRQATYHAEHQAQVQEFTTTADLQECLRKHGNSGYDAVFHAAAVSDFGFGNIWVRAPGGELAPVRSGKISTRQGTLLAELVPTPKLIAHLREWFPAARLIGWKFEVEGERSSVIRQARKQIADCHTDACVANGPAYGPGFGLVKLQGEPAHFSDMPMLFDALEKFIQV